jgi:hypothetical protein
MFLPSLSDCIPSLEVWQGQWKAKQQAHRESEAAAKQVSVFQIYIFIQHGWSHSKEEKAP